MSTGTSNQPANISRRAFLGGAAISLAGAAAKEHFLYVFFRDPGSSGVFFALSEDGYRWEPLNSDKPWIVPQHEGMLMRDPFIAQGPDGVYHLIWTWGWRRDAKSGKLQIGYSSSKDLLTWSEQQSIPIFPSDPTVLNAWAPELIYDRSKKEWMIFWSSTIPARFKETLGQCKGDSNHRIYAMNTRDFQTFTEPRLLLEPGYPVIDATILEERGRFVMVFKDEREFPVRKNLQLAFAAKADGPYTGVTEPFSKDWEEGPSILRIGADYLVYFDHYRDRRYYGAYRSRDLRKWEEVSEKMSFPPACKHGSFLRIPERTAVALRSRRS